MGDSITEGFGARVPYWRVLSDRTGAECVGAGICGTRIAPNRGPSPDRTWDLHFASRVDSLPEDADIVAVFGGTNDFGTGDAPLGAPEDRDQGTFRGAMRVLVEKLILRFPHALLFVMTPLHRLGEEDCSYNEFGVRRCSDLRGYVDAIRGIAEYYSLPVLDLYRVSGIQPALEVLRETFMPDGLHPNDAGHRRIADRLEGFLLSL